MPQKPTCFQLKIKKISADQPIYRGVFMANHTYKDVQSCCLFSLSPANNSVVEACSAKRTPPSKLILGQALVHWIS